MLREIIVSILGEASQSPGDNQYVLTAMSTLCQHLQVMGGLVGWRRDAVPLDEQEWLKACGGCQPLPGAKKTSRSSNIPPNAT